MTNRTGFDQMSRLELLIECQRLYENNAELLAALETIELAETATEQCHECYVCSEHEEQLEIALTEARTAIAAKEE